MFTAHGLGEKEADSFIPAHRKKHNELGMCARMCAHTCIRVCTHAYTHTHTQGSDKWEAELLYRLPCVS